MRFTYIIGINISMEIVKTYCGGKHAVFICALLAHYLTFLSTQLKSVYDFGSTAWPQSSFRKFN